MPGIDPNERLEILRQVLNRVNRIRGAHRNASAAVDAPRRVYINLFLLFETGFILLRVDAVCRTNICAQKIFDALVGNDVCHVVLLDAASPAYTRPITLTVIGVTAWMCFDAN